MSKKNGIKRLFERTAIEPADTQPRSKETPQVDQPEEVTPAVETSEEQGMEPSVADSDTAEELPTPDEVQLDQMEPFPTEPGAEVAASEPATPEMDEKGVREAEELSSATSLTSADAEESVSEDALEAVRRSLIEEDTDKTEKESRWWRRFGRKSKRTEPEASPTNVEIDLPSTLAQSELVQDQTPATQPEEYADDIDELIDMLEAENQAPAAEPPTDAPNPETPPEPEPEVDFEQLKEQAFRPRPVDDETESATDVRSIALEDGEEVFVEVQAQAPDQFEERVKSIENALKPYRRYLYLTLAFLGIVMAVIASLLIFNVYQRSRPVPVREAPNLPYPTGVSLPGGWSFQLGRGALENGRWEPAGAEWLEGTEVCRWVSLPWSRQLEAVIRTLNPDDPIELTMSNNDELVYSVYSVQEMTAEEIQQLDSNTPCLLIILTQAGSEARWVLTALP
jgi:hypothetical protein